MEALAERENLAANSVARYRRALTVNRLGLAVLSGAIGAVVGQLLQVLHTAISEWTNGLLANWASQLQGTLDLLLWAGTPSVRLGLLLAFGLLLASAWVQDLLAWRQLQRDPALNR
jgi:hypothetical protein